MNLKKISGILAEHQIGIFAICKTTIIGFIMSIIMLELGYVWFRKADLK